MGFRDELESQRARSAALQEEVERLRDALREREAADGEPEEAEPEDARAAAPPDPSPGASSEGSRPWLFYGVLPVAFGLLMNAAAAAVPVVSIPGAQLFCAAAPAQVRTITYATTSRHGDAVGVDHTVQCGARSVPTWQVICGTTVIYGLVVALFFALLERGRGRRSRGLAWAGGPLHLAVACAIALPMWLDVSAVVVAAAACAMPVLHLTGTLLVARGWPEEERRRMSLLVFFLAPIFAAVPFGGALFGVFMGFGLAIDDAAYGGPGGLALAAYGAAGTASMLSVVL